MKKILFLFPVLTLAAMLAASSAKAQLISVGYDFASHPTGAAPATTTDPNVTLSGVTRGPGYQDGNNPQYFAAGGLSVSPNGTAGQAYFSDVPSSTTAGFYVVFTLTPTTAISLTNLTFGGSFQNGSATGSTTVGLSYSTDGSSFTEVAPTTTTLDGNGDGGTGSPTVSSFDLSSQANLLADTQAVTFRLFVLSTSQHGYEDASYVNPNGTNGLDVEIDGAVPAPVPEPATWAFLAAGAGLLVCVQRARCRAA